MKNIEFYVNQIKENKDIEDQLSCECGIDFESREILEDDLSALMECGKCDYTLKPFGCDGSGGIYAVLDNGKIGYIDSEGQAGIVANNIKDFFSIIINCGYISDWAKFGCLENKETFMSYFYEIEIPRNQEFIKRFIKDNLLESQPEKIYDIFKEAVISEPKLIIVATSEDYEDSVQLFEL